MTGVGERGGWPSLVLPALIAALALPPPGAAASSSAETAAGKIVVRAKFKRFDATERRITYTSPKGNYSATWIGIRRYRLRGTIHGRTLKGTIRTRQARDGTRYRARGSGTLGGRRVRISGGGPNSLKTARLVLR